MSKNSGKRDILIFPKFNNIDKIQEIRNKYEGLEVLTALSCSLLTLLPCSCKRQWVGLNTKMLGVIFTCCLCCSQHAMPFWRISSHSDLMALHHALELEYL